MVQLPKVRLQDKQGGGSAMIWAGIIDDAIMGSFAVSDGEKMNAQSYVEFLKKKFSSLVQEAAIGTKRGRRYLCRAMTHSTQLVSLATP